jgi:flagellar assembly protein FliH
MGIEPINLRNFDPGALVTGEASVKNLLPGGRRRGEGPPPPPPTFSEEQVKTAEREAYKKGFLEGIEEGRRLQDSEQAVTDRKLMETLEHFIKAASPLLQDYGILLKHAKQEIPKVSLSIARKVAGGALAKNAQAVVEETALKCAELMLGEPKLVVTVHASFAESLKTKLAQLAATVQNTDSLEVVGNDSMPLPDCRVEWKHGALLRNTDKLWQDISKVVEGMSAAGEHAAQDKMEILQAALQAVTQTTPDQKE